MQFVVDRTGSIAALDEAIHTLSASGAGALQVLAAIGNGWDSAMLDPLIANSPVPIFGGMFPGVVAEGERLDRGAIILAHASPVRIDIVSLRGDTPKLDVLADDTSGRSLVAWYDATCSTGPLLDLLFDELGAGPTWVGGGAGALDFAERPVVITPLGLLGGVAVVASLAERLLVGVAHGWEPFGATLRVTESRGNDAIALNWRPAFDVYREIVERHSGRRFDDEAFFDLASRYPLILERFDGEGIVRDPLEVLTDGSLRCAGEIPLHATVRIATGEVEQMLDAAVTARVRAETDGVPENAISLAIDCISRALILQERLHDELARLRPESTPQVGALTIGEIANCRRRYLQLHNKTAVVGVLGP
jgi:hypothetical protein